MDSVVEGAREMASSLQRFERRASVSSISPGRDLRDDNNRSKVAYMLILKHLNPGASSSLHTSETQHVDTQLHNGTDIKLRQESKTQAATFFLSFLPSVLRAVAPSPLLSPDSLPPSLSPNKITDIKTTPLCRAETLTLSYCCDRGCGRGWREGLQRSWW